MDKIITNLIKLQNQLRINHWQARKYGEHKALGKAYDDLGDLIDNLVEVHQGKYGVIKYNSPIELGLVNTEEISMQDILQEVDGYLRDEFNAMTDEVSDSECRNIRDEILAVINRLRYLLTLQ
jgi:hypothetical protein